MEKLDLNQVLSRWGVQVHAALVASKKADPFSIIWVRYAAASGSALELGSLIDQAMSGDVVDQVGVVDGYGYSWVISRDHGGPWITKEGCRD